MHGDIGAAVEYRHLYLLDKNAFATDDAQRRLGVTVARSLNNDEFSLFAHARGNKLLSDVASLPEREVAASGGDTHVSVEVEEIAKCGR